MTVICTHRFPVGHVMADRAADCGPSKGVMAGKMAADGADGRTLQATPRICAPHGDQT
jgi:hypothetical protein